MPYYLVEVREVHVSLRRVEADNVEDAMHDGPGGTEISLEYSRTLDQPIDPCHVTLDSDQTEHRVLPFAESTVFDD